VKKLTGLAADGVHYGRGLEYGFHLADSKSPKATA